jgi:multiple sugar transport system substrate-binding protein
MMEHGRQFPQAIRDLLNQFERDARQKIDLRVLSWQDAWAELVRGALYGDGADVSEIGSTWLSEFVGMGSLRPFRAAELQNLGHAAQFLPSAWQSTHLSGEGRAPDSSWAVPWASDTRLIYYRHDVFERAGVDAQWAFQTPQTLLQACARLRAAGVHNPVALPTRFTHITLHNIASWVWGSGGDFLSPDQKQVRFDALPARTGIQAYFDLAQYLSPEQRDLDEHGVHAAYRRGDVSMTLIGTWLQSSLKAVPDVGAHTRHALPPGVPYLGGSQLVIWKHTRQPGPALELLHYLASAEVQLRLIHNIGLLPARLDVLAHEIFQQDPFYRQVAEGLKQARAFPAFPLWGLVEKRLTEAFTTIWAEIFSTAEPEVHAIVDQQISAAARRVNAILASH